MAVLFPLPTSVLGWVWWAVAVAVQVLAVVTIVRDVRGRRMNGWDVAALAFVVLVGPFAALLFLAVHSVLEARERRRAQRLREARASAAQPIRSASATTIPSGPRT